MLVAYLSLSSTCSRGSDVISYYVPGAIDYWGEELFPEVGETVKQARQSAATKESPNDVACSSQRCQSRVAAWIGIRWWHTCTCLESSTTVLKYDSNKEWYYFLLNTIQCAFVNDHRV